MCNGSNNDKMERSEVMLRFATQSVRQVRICTDQSKSKDIKRT